MKLTQLFLTENACYQSGKRHTVKGIMVHSTGANNLKLSRYIAPDDGVIGPNKEGIDWNTAKPGGISVCVHGFIGKDKNGVVRTYQTLPWDMVGRHSGSGSLGRDKNANNTGFIGFEICEDALTDGAYFAQVYREATELCAYLCKQYRLDPKTDIICHSEGHTLGIASNHADVMHWFPKHGKSMDTFRADVAALLAVKPVESAPVKPSGDTPTKPTESVPAKPVDSTAAKALIQQKCKLSDPTAVLLMLTLSNTRLSCTASGPPPTGHLKAGGVRLEKKDSFP